MTCTRYRDHLDAEGRPGSDRGGRVALERHADGCADCAAERRRRSVLAAAFGTHATPLSPALRARLQRAAAGAIHGADEPDTVLEIIGLCRRWAPRLAVAAALLLAVAGYTFREAFDRGTGEAAPTMVASADSGPTGDLRLDSLFDEGR